MRFQLANNALGKHYRDTISFEDAIELFSSEEESKVWLEKLIWPDGPVCPKCGSKNIQHNVKHPSMSYRCRDCQGRTLFSLNSSPVMHSSPLSYRKWAIATYLVAINHKGVSSMRMRHELKITQKAAWHLLH